MADPHDVGVDADPLRFTEAIAQLQRLVPMTEDEYVELDAAEQEFAFTLANVAEADVVADVLDALRSSVEDGTPFEDFRDAVQDQLEESWGGDKPGRVESIFRTAVMTSYNDGRYDRMTSPAVAEARPFWRYDGIEDARACPICEPCDGVIMPLTAEWWQRHYPILHPNCRDVATPMSRDEAQAAGITLLAPESPDPPDGFGTPPAGIGGDDWTPDLGGYDDDLAGLLSDKLDDGDQG